MSTPFDSAALAATLAYGPALVAALAAGFAGSGIGGVEAAWRAARWAATAALAMAAVVLAQALIGAHVHKDLAGGLMLLLVAFVGWVIVRYSQTYLSGERDERRYVVWLMATLAAVGVVVATDHVLTLALAWSCTGLTLHRLLTFYPERSPAVLAAHKKFVVARVADVCMLLAVAVLWQAFGTLQISQIAALAATPPAGAAAPAAALLIAAAALLRCAQLPFHGWLIQVMEAPTPVSALLHAGIINLGGFVLIRFAPLIGQVPAAQVLLVAVGSATAVLAALVMSTRISVKVALAWSTCAQMGFMLMQCGLGAWEMALLHLLAHSLYKAHAFLGAGGAVRRSLLARLAPRAEAPSAADLAVGAAIGIGMTAAAGAAWRLLQPGQPPAPHLWVLAGIVALALVPLLRPSAWRLGGAWPLALAGSAFGVAFGYFGLHVLFASQVLPGVEAPPSGVRAALAVAVALAFFGLFLLQSTIAVAPGSALARRLYTWFYGGLFLDESFNRVVFRLWRPPAAGPAITALPQVDVTLAPVRAEGVSP